MVSGLFEEVIKVMEWVPRRLVAEVNHSMILNFESLCYVMI